MSIEDKKVNRRIRVRERRSGIGHHIASWKPKIKEIHGWLVNDALCHEKVKSSEEGGLLSDWPAFDFGGACPWFFYLVDYCYCSGISGSVG